MEQSQTIPVAAPVDTDSAGRGGNEALQSVFRIVSPATRSSGTGFLHKSGHLITAEHVIRDTPQPFIVLADGTTVPSKITAMDWDTDLALLEPSKPISGPSLSVSSKTDLAVGAHVSTWGFPGGYIGALPILSVGYLSGVTAFRDSTGKTVEQWVVNAAFNSGNSGGPLILIETGEVIGVVSSKLAPISPPVRSALAALENQESGFIYTANLPNGTTKEFSEGQVIASVLNELRQQVQLVIGMAVLLENLTSFLKSAQIDP